MKKLLIFLFILFVPSIINAETYCSIVNGNGTKIGDEIKCGTESFYVFSRDENNINLLTKYNLLVGDKIDYIAKDSAQELDEKEEYDYCLTEAMKAGYNPYYIYLVFDTINNQKTLKGCRIYEKIEYDKVRQDERAVGTKLDGEGKSVLPLYGITYMNPRWGYEALHDNIIRENNYDENGDLVLENSSFYNYINGYKEELENQGIKVENVSFPTLTRTLNLLENISGKEITVKFEELSDDLEYTDPEFNIRKMNIKDYIGEKNNWISDVTFWLGSGFIGEPADYPLVPDVYNDYYISNEGMLCAIGRGECAYFEYPIGNGVRPLVTISKKILRYNITTKTDGNGSIEVVNSSLGEETINFKVTSKKGYKLKKIIITSDTGETINFVEGNNVSNSDGTTSIDNNTFTMPYDNITIEAKWDIINPETGNHLFFAFSILIIFSGIIYYLKKEKINKL